MKTCKLSRLDGVISAKTYLSAKGKESDFTLIHCENVKVNHIHSFFALRKIWGDK